ncbi:MAG TPA: dihydrolipoyl dehydrogenase [Polyangiaceae bacterium]|nr:dihydrolipoyl dehydrogenase [Polyangiaceae bacterium]
MSASESAFDIIVVGAGPAGYSAAIRLAQRGWSVACIEREAVGGVCLNWGCIPSKALITTAQRLSWAREGAELGVLADNVRLDLPRAQRRHRSVVQHHTGGVASLLKSNGARLLYGSARLLSPRRVALQLPDGGTRELEARRAIVLASGARPRSLPGFEPDGRHVLTAREAIFLEQLPEHLIVIGAGVIGVELGGAYQRLGSRLSLIEIGPSLLPGVDADLVQVVQQRFERGGAQLYTSARALEWQPHGDGVRVRVQTPAGEQQLEGSRLLVAAGFVPNSAGLGLEELGIRSDAAGHVLSDERCETSVPGVFAIGDLAGPPYLAHKAYKEAEVLGHVLAGERVVRDWRAMPAVVFSDPEIASVGLSEARAREQGGEVVVGKFPFSALGRAQAMAETQGFVKLIARDQRLVGAGVVGPEASELIAELTLALEVGASLEDLALTVHSHPTLAEAVHEAAEQGLGQSVHILNRKRRAAHAAPLAPATP